MLFLVSLANQGIPDGAYLLGKLYARGLVRLDPSENEGEEATQTVLIARNIAKAAVWCTVACTLA